MKFLRQLNSKADIVSEHYKKQNKAWWDSLLSKDNKKIVSDSKNDTYSAFDTFSMTGVSIKSPECLIYTLENLIRGSFCNIIRAKGTVAVANGMCLKFDVAALKISL